MGQLAYHAGNAAEGAVARHYCAKGLEIVAKRWRAARADGGGEIDLIARNGTQIIFIEVKKSHSHAQAAQMLGARQMACIARSAAVFLAGEPAGQNTEARFDVALVDSFGSVEIIENAYAA